MIAPFLVLLALPTVTPDPTSLSGRCTYSQEVARYRHETTLILCDQLEIAQADGGASLDFGQRSWGSMLRVTGTLSGSRITVTHVRPRSGGTMDASGTCELYYKSERISRVSCLVRAGAKSWAADFLASRL